MKRIISLFLIVILGTGVLAGCANEKQYENLKSSDADVTRVAAKLPELSFHAESEEDIISDKYFEYKEEIFKLVRESREIAPELRSFYEKVFGEFLSSDKENCVFSPLNIYFALAVLAETASGETREQILDLLGASDVETLRKNVKALWLGNYSDDPVVQCQLANSIWLRNDIGYNNELLDLLAESYFTDTFAGPMGSEEYDKALQEWTNEKTGHLLEDSVKGLTMNQRTVMAILSAIYFKAAWSDAFSKDQTDRQTFHGLSGDQECEMMHSTHSNNYYAYSNFAAVALSLQDCGNMFFILPDEGVKLSEVAKNTELLDLIQSPYDSENAKYLIVNMSVPKFSLNSKIDLKEPLENLGVTDIFEVEKADFSKVSDEITDPLFISKAEHAAIVEIDEEGVTGAAYTALMNEAGAAMPPDDEVDFTLDRPFMYVVTGTDGSILFAGTVLDLE